MSDNREGHNVYLAISDNITNAHKTNLVYLNNVYLLVQHIFVTMVTYSVELRRLKSN